MIKTLEPEKIAETADFPNMYLRLYFEGCPGDKILCLSFRVIDSGFIESFGKFCGLFEKLIEKNQHGLASKSSKIYGDYFNHIINTFKQGTQEALEACGQKEIEIDKENDCKIIWQIEIIKSEVGTDILGKQFEYTAPRVLNIPIDSISKKSLIKFVRVYKEVAENIDFYTAFIGVQSSEDDNDNTGNRLINVINNAGTRLLNSCIGSYYRRK
tara:strand:- start:5174 stop:5812 length:639 start_codon:yes stop_codon:yes gene_type:complete